MSENDKPAERLNAAILKRLRCSGVEDYELDSGVCKAAADEIERLRDWIRSEGERTDQCTYNVLGEICDGCRCKRKHPNTKLCRPADSEAGAP